MKKAIILLLLFILFGMNFEKTYAKEQNPKNVVSEIGTITKEEAENFYAFCRTYLVRFMFLMTDESLTSLGKKVPDLMDYTSGNTLIDFSSNINAQLYTAIDLTSEEISYVEEKIRTVDANRSLVTGNSSTKG